MRAQEINRVNGGSLSRHKVFNWWRARAPLQVPVDGNLDTICCCYFAYTPITITGGAQFEKDRETHTLTGSALFSSRECLVQVLVVFPFFFAHLVVRLPLIQPER